jgi:hypothetical protein
MQTARSARYFVSSGVSERELARVDADAKDRAEDVGEGRAQYA